MKGKPKGYGKKEKDQDPASARGQKGKSFAAWDNDRPDTAFWGKGKGKRARKE